MLIIKIGGGKDINWQHISRDIAMLSKTEEIIVVHGANARRDKVAQELGTPVRHLTAPSGNKSVYTDARALEVMTMVYSGLENKRIVATLQQAGVAAVGLSGADGRIWEGKRKKHLISLENGKEKLISDTFTGKVEKINVQLLKQLTESGYVPVITQPAISYEGELINTDNDRTVSLMARELQAKQLVILFEAPGLLGDHTNESTLIPTLNKDQLETVMKTVSGRMKMKVLGAQEALTYGVQTIFWGDGRIENPITRALAGEGTTIS